MYLYIRNGQHTYDEDLANTVVKHTSQGEIIEIQVYSVDVKDYVVVSMTDWKSNRANERLIEKCQRVVDEVISHPDFGKIDPMDVSKILAGF